jgi:hypothetical protein
MCVTHDSLGTIFEIGGLKRISGKKPENKAAQDLAKPLIIDVTLLI